MFESKLKKNYKFELGSTVKDKVTGFEGIATGVASYITGCDQYCIQPPLKDGSFVDSKWFDDNRLELTDKKVLELKLDDDVGACEQAPTK
jgi:hypothetical protein